MNQSSVSTLLVTAEPSNRTGSISWPEASSVKQFCSLPPSIIYYITKNPSTPKAYQKLIQSCKYFFEKNPIIVAARIYGKIKKICSKNNMECNYSSKCCVTFDITKLSSKIWLTNQLTIVTHTFDIPKFASLFISKIYQCAQALTILYGEEIVMKNFELLASNFHKFYMFNIRIVDNDGNIVMLDKILESISTVKEFEYQFNRHAPSANATTMKNINKLTNLSNLRKIEFLYFPEVFNIEDLYEFLKKHKNTKIRLLFQSNISEHYKYQLDKLIDSIIASDVSKHYIIYYGQNQEKSKIMYDRYYG